MTNLYTTHKLLVHDLWKDGIELIAEFDSRDHELNHAVMGISGEAGELLDAIKKHTIYRKPLDLENVKEELGDIEFFLEALRQVLGITREECIMSNIVKLQKRYPQGIFTNDQAQQRLDKNEA